MESSNRPGEDLAEAAPQAPLPAMEHLRDNEENATSTAAALERFRNVGQQTAEVQRSAESAETQLGAREQLGELQGSAERRALSREVLQERGISVREHAEVQRGVAEALHGTEHINERNIFDEGVTEAEIEASGASGWMKSVAKWAREEGFFKNIVRGIGETLYGWYMSAKGLLKPKNLEATKAKMLALLPPAFYAKFNITKDNWQRTMEYLAAAAPALEPGSKALLEKYHAAVAAYPERATQAKFWRPLWEQLSLAGYEIVLTPTDAPHTVALRAASGELLPIAPLHKDSLVTKALLDSLKDVGLVTTEQADAATQAIEDRAGPELPHSTEQLAAASGLFLKAQGARALQAGSVRLANAGVYGLADAARADAAAAGRITMAEAAVRGRAQLDWEEKNPNLLSHANADPATKLRNTQDKMGALQQQIAAAPTPTEAAVLQRKYDKLQKEEQRLLTKHPGLQPAAPAGTVRVNVLDDLNTRIAEADTKVNAATNGAEKRLAEQQRESLLRQREQYRNDTEVLARSNERARGNIELFATQHTDALKNVRAEMDKINDEVGKLLGGPRTPQAEGRLLHLRQRMDDLGRQQQDLYGQIGRMLDSKALHNKGVRDALAASGAFATDGGGKLLVKKTARGLALGGMAVGVGALVMQGNMPSGAAIARVAGQAALGMIPFVGTGMDAMEAIRGTRTETDPETGEEREVELGTMERLTSAGFAVAGVLSDIALVSGIGTAAGVGGRAAIAAAKGARATARGVRAARGLEQAARAERLVDAGAGALRRGMNSVRNGLETTMDTLRMPKHVTADALREAAANKMLQGRGGELMEKAAARAAKAGAWGSKAMFVLLPVQFAMDIGGGTLESLGDTVAEWKDTASNAVDTATTTAARVASVADALN